MIIILKPGTEKTRVEDLAQEIEEYGVKVNINWGTDYAVFGLLGDTGSIDKDKVELIDCVDRVMRVQEPYKRANQKFHAGKTIVEVAGQKIGNGEFIVMAGPCSVEGEDQICSIARDVKASGANFLRGGAFKPRTSPYAFQGLEEEGIELLKIAREKTGLPIVSEIMSPRLCDLFEQEVDVVQIGARNMQNFDLLKEVGKMRKPVLLKRGISNTIEEWLMSAEYILAGGNENVILCERGIRTFENYTRNTLDISAVLAIKKLSHLPIIIDPSHATGMSWMVEPLAMASLAVGADGVIIEVHNDPLNAKCDGPQSLTPVQFDSLMRKLRSMEKNMED